MCTQFGKGMFYPGHPRRLAFIDKWSVVFKTLDLHKRGEDGINTYELQVEPRSIFTIN